MRLRAFSGRLAFSLLELMSVLVLCAVLVALLHPVISKIKAKGGNVRCARNLAQIGVAYRLYEQDHGEFPPYSWYGDVVRWYDGSEESTSFFAGPYLKSAPRLKRSWNPPGAASKGGYFDCPSITAKEKEGRGPADWVNDYFDYGLNLTLCGRRAVNIARPSETVVCVDGGHFGRVKARNVHGLTYTPDQTTNPGGTNWDYSPSPIIYPHEGKASFLFLDGHVRTHAPSEPSESWFNTL